MDLHISAEQLTGSVPDSLRGGRLLSNGPGWNQYGDTFIHPFDGHGYLRSFAFNEDGSVDVKARFIETESYNIESEKNDLIVRGFATNPHDQFWKNLPRGIPKPSQAHGIPMSVTTSGFLEPTAGPYFGVQQHVDCTPASTTLKVSWTPFAGGTAGFGGAFPYPTPQGAFIIDGCTGVSPTLHLQSGVEYTFDQSDVSNWYHPFEFTGDWVGVPNGGKGNGGHFALGLGAYNQDEKDFYWDSIEDTLPKKRTYYANGAEMDHFDYRSNFYFPKWEWKKTAFHLTLKIEPSYTNADGVMYTPKEMYYNCHHHFGFTGKIIVEDVDTPQMFPTAAADPNLDKLDALSEFEASCGAFYLNNYETNPVCDGKQFLCGDKGDATRVEIGAPYHPVHCANAWEDEDGDHLHLVASCWPPDAVRRLARSGSSLLGSWEQLLDGDFSEVPKAS